MSATPLVQTAALGMALPVVENYGRWLCAYENGALRALEDRR